MAVSNERGVSHDVDALEEFIAIEFDGVPPGAVELVSTHEVWLLETPLLCSPCKLAAAVFTGRWQHLFNLDGTPYAYACTRIREGKADIVEYGYNPHAERVWRAEKQLGACAADARLLIKPSEQLTLLWNMQTGEYAVILPGWIET